jgi:hypothetical protein
MERTKTCRQNSKYAYLYRLGTGAEANVRVKCATCGYVKSDPAPAYVVKGVSAGRYVAGKLRCPGCPSVDGKNPERFFKPYDSRPPCFRQPGRFVQRSKEDFVTGNQIM